MSGKPSRAPLASEPMSTVLVDILATATCMCCANFGTQLQSHGATNLAVEKFEAEGGHWVGIKPGSSVSTLGKGKPFRLGNYNKFAAECE